MSALKNANIRWQLLLDAIKNRNSNKLKRFIPAFYYLFSVKCPHSIIFPTVFSSFLDERMKIMFSTRKI